MNKVRRDDDDSLRYLLVSSTFETNVFIVAQNKLIADTNTATISVMGQTRAKKDKGKEN